MSLPTGSAQGRRGLVTELLTFDRLMTGPVVHLIYWCGLCLILLIGFGAVGASIGLALRGGSIEVALAAIPAIVVALLIIGVLSLIWRGACEFYLAVFRIAEDLRTLRIVTQREAQAAAARVPPSAPYDGDLRL
jgi:hypothetical protein